MYVSRKTPGNLEGTHELWGTIVCATKYIYIYISQQSMFWRNSWVLGIPTSHILTACKPIYIRCWFRAVAKIYISTRDVSPKNEGTIGLWGTPALYLPHSNRLQNHVFPKNHHCFEGTHGLPHSNCLQHQLCLQKKLLYFQWNAWVRIIMPEKSIHMYVCICCGKQPFLWWLGGSRIYIYICVCVSAWKKIYPWRHSNCWLPNSFMIKQRYLSMMGILY